MSRPSPSEEEHNMHQNAITRSVSGPPNCQRTIADHGICRDPPERTSSNDADRRVGSAGAQKALSTRRPRPPPGITSPQKVQSRCRDEREENPTWSTQNRSSSIPTVRFALRRASRAPVSKDGCVSLGSVAGHHFRVLETKTQERGRQPLIPSKPDQGLG